MSLGLTLALLLTMVARWWTSISIVLILLSFIIFGFFSRKPLCIDSRLVDKIDRVSDDGSEVSVYRCGLHKAVPYDEKWSQSLAALSRRVQRVEKFIDFISPLQGYLHVTVVEKKSWSYKIIGREIFLSEESLVLPGPLEKALIKAWLRDKSSPQLEDHPLLEESLSDLLLFAIYGNLQIEDPHLKITPEISNIEKWPFVVKSLAGYCRSPWRQLEHQQICQKDSVEAGTTDSNLVPLSLRPLLTQAMIASFMELGSAERRLFLESLPRILNVFQVNSQGVGFSSVDYSRQSFVEIFFEVSSILKALSADHFNSEHAGGLQNNAYEKWTVLLNSQMLARGFSDELSEAHLDHLIALVHVGSDLQVQSLFKAVQSMKSLTVALIDQEQIYLLPGVEPVPKNTFGRIRAQRATLVVCGALSLGDLDQYSEVTTRLTVIDSCDESLPINYDGILQGQIDKFALQNPDLSFVEVHLPSLHLALTKRQVNPLLKLAMNFEEPLLLQALGWQQPLYDKGLKAYHANSAIEAFKLYRPHKKMSF